MKHKFYYVMDPLCGWCYGFTPVVLQVRDAYKDVLDVQVIPGGMITGSRVGPVSEMAEYILQAYKKVEEYAGVQFGWPYLDMLQRGTEINDSEPPCRAIYTFQQIHPDQALDFTHALQLKLFREGKSLNNEYTYRELAEDFNTDPDAFIAAMATEESRYGTIQEFQWVEAAGITGFPCVILKKDGEYFLLARGFQPYEGFRQVLERGLK